MLLNSYRLGLRRALLASRTFPSCGLAPSTNFPRFCRALSTQKSPVAEEKSQLNLDSWMASNYPTMHKYYRLAIDGSKLCFLDLKTYLTLYWGLRNRRITLDDFNARDMLIYIQTESEAKKLCVLALVAVLPSGIPVLIGSMLVAPRLVLTRHFWTDEQSLKYQTRELKHNEYNQFPTIIGSLKELNPQAPLSRLPLPIDQLISTGKQMTIPSSPDQLTWKHKLALKRLHRLRFWSSNEALLKRAKLLQMLDAKMVEEQRDRDKCVASMGLRELRTHLYLRKLNYEGLTADQMRAMLAQWLKQFKNPCDPMLYAHAPVLMQAHAEDAERWEKQSVNPEISMEKLKQLRPDMDKLKEVDWSELGKQGAAMTRKSVSTGRKAWRRAEPKLSEGARWMCDAVKRTIRKAKN